MSGNITTDADETTWLKAMIAEGLASGVNDKEPEAIVEEVIARRRARERERNLRCK